MRIFIHVIILFTGALLFAGCIKQATLVYRAPNPSLVVEGLLLTDSTPCTITLSRSGIFSREGGQSADYINDATVYLKSDAGDSIKLYTIGNGQYQSAATINAKVGSSYSLAITLSNGKRYASVPEKIAPVTKSFSLDSIHITSDYAYGDLYGAQMEISTQDPANEVNYYRWISVDWAAREATGVPCGINPCFVYCFQYYHDPTIYILPDKYINGSEIHNQVALTTPLYTVGRHYIELKQMSLTKNAFEFWRLYQEQTTRSGSILDPLPSPIPGNVYSLDNSNELVLGYFEASDVASIKFVFAPLYLNSYYTLRNRPNHISVGACYLVYPNALNDAPPGWDTAPEYIYNVY